TQVRSEDVSGLVGFALLKGDAQIGRGIHQNLLRFLVVLVVVDRFSKYAHFATLPTSFNAPKVAEMFVEAVVKHHGIPKTIVSDRDPIFVSKVWTQLFKLSGSGSEAVAEILGEYDEGFTVEQPLAVCGDMILVELHLQLYKDT
nr:Ty3/gypsy retrotransposon protein [Tanacetum cinerariifolium]